MNRTWKQILPTGRQLARRSQITHSNISAATTVKRSSNNHVNLQQKRMFTQSAIRPISFKGLFGSSKSNDDSIPENKIILEQDNLFHILSKSPLPEMRDRAAIINKYGVCPVCDTHHEQHEAKKKPTFDCPDCGYPTHCSEEHYHQGKLAHQEVCGILREMNQDDHDLRSGRPMREFEFPSKFSMVLTAALIVY